MWKSKDNVITPVESLWESLAWSEICLNPPDCRFEGTVEERRGRNSSQQFPMCNLVNSNSSMKEEIILLIT